jgi:hypothetical protein
MAWHALTLQSREVKDNDRASEAGREREKVRFREEEVRPYSLNFTPMRIRCVSSMRA